MLSIADTAFGVTVEGGLTSYNLSFALQQTDNAYAVSLHPILL